MGSQQYIDLDAMFSNSDLSLELKISPYNPIDKIKEAVNKR